MLDILGITGPIYLIIALGYAVTRRGWFDKADMRVLGKFVIQLGLPALLFSALAQRRVMEVLRADYLLAYAAGSLAVIGAALWWSLRVARRSRSAAAYAAMGMSCSNSGFIGYPVVMLAFGAPVAGVVLALNFLVENLLKLPLLLAVADSEGAPPGAWHQTLGRVLTGLLRNPLVIAIVAGFAWSLLAVPMPQMLARTIGLVAQTSGALALFVIGGSLVGLQARGLGAQVTQIALGKLLLHPLAVALALWVIPVQDPALRAAAVVSAGMPMLGIYPLLAQKHGHGEASAAALLVTTAASFVTLNVLLAVLPR